MSGIESSLRAGALRLKIELSIDAMTKFERYYDMLRESVVNLTAIKGEHETGELHFTDSLSILPVIRPGDVRVIDVGTGAGFPGLPMKIAMPRLELTLLDSQLKRVEFLSNLTARLALTDVHCVCGRAEELGRDNILRGSFDIAVSRAVSKLRVICELSMPFVRVGGLFIAQKSESCDDEIEESLDMISELGGAVERVESYELPMSQLRRRLVIIQKVHETPEVFPRRYAKIIRSTRRQV